MLAVGYVRVSTDHQENSPDAQRHLIQEYCKKNNLQFLKFYEDLAISGATIAKRPGINELILDAEKKLFNCVIFYKYDRAFRNLAEQIVCLKKLNALGVKTIPLADPVGQGASGELITNILGAVNQFERELTGERIRVVKRQQATQGKWSTSAEPYGYIYDKETKKLIVVPEEAKVIKELFQLYVEHKSSNKVAQILRERGHISKKGQPWVADRVLAALRNEIYIGKIRWGYWQKASGNVYKRNVNGDYELYDGQHEAIIDEQIFYKAKEIRDKNSVTGRKCSRRHLLSGMITCAKCGGTVRSKTASKDSYKFYDCLNRYRLGNCDGWTKAASHLETAVLDAVRENIGSTNLEVYYENAAAQEAIEKESEDTIKRKIKSIEDKIKRQIDLFEDGIITLQELKERREAALKEKQSLEIELKKSKTPGTLTQEMLELINSFDYFWKEIEEVHLRRNYLATIIDRIYSDSKTARIVFQPFPFLGWKKEIIKQLPHGKLRKH